MGSKGAAKGVGEKVGSITRDQLEEIAKTKLPDLNADKIESAMRIVAGTAHNMGVTIEGWDIEESKAGFREEKAAIWGLKPEQLTQAQTSVRCRSPTTTRERVTQHA